MKNENEHLGGTPKKWNKQSTRVYSQAEARGGTVVLEASMSVSSDQKCRWLLTYSCRGMMMMTYNKHVYTYTHTYICTRPLHQTEHTPQARTLH